MHAQVSSSNGSWETPSFSFDPTSWVTNASKICEYTIIPFGSQTQHSTASVSALFSSLNMEFHNFSHCLQKCILSLPILFVVSAQGVESKVEERLSLRAVILKALENNNDIMIQDLGRLVEAEKIKVASQVLNPRIEGSYVYMRAKVEDFSQGVVNFVKLSY
jgi:hypothetical protein